MRVAIYSRKSRFTGKGESIGNQIQLCRDYLGSHFSPGQPLEITVYEDEGYSGGDTERPQYQEMLRDARSGKFDVLVCYRLDRISRNVNDFSSLIEQLEENRVGFISIREQFDTTTPMGRAMMYISSVFAQLERDTIAERIRDNMLELAKTGRWLGGIPPTGFASEEVFTVDAHGKERKAHKLQPVPHELGVVALLYARFTELGSLTGLEAYCLRNGITSRNGKPYSRFTLKEILTNPVYAAADHAVYGYLLANGYEVYAPPEDFDGVHGLLAYNKTRQKKHAANKERDKSEWILAVGRHEGAVPGALWIRAQELLERNKSKSFRKVRSSGALLSGLLRCGDCGAFMRPKASGRTDREGRAVFYYMCETKEKSRRGLCRMGNANGNELDRLVLGEIKRLPESRSELAGRLRAEGSGAEPGGKTEEETLREAVRANGQAIKRLVASIAGEKNTAASKHVVEKINELDRANEKYRQRLEQLHGRADGEKAAGDRLETIDRLLSSFSAAVDSLSVQQKRSLLRSVVERVEWDGTGAKLTLSGKRDVSSAIG